MVDRFWGGGTSSRVVEVRGEVGLLEAFLSEVGTSCFYSYSIVNNVAISFEVPL